MHTSTELESLGIPAFVVETLHWRRHDAPFRLVGRFDPCVGMPEPCIRAIAAYTLRPRTHSPWRKTYHRLPPARRRTSPTPLRCSARSTTTVYTARARARERPLRPHARARQSAPNVATTPLRCCHVTPLTQGTPPEIEFEQNAYVDLTLEPNVVLAW